MRLCFNHRSLISSGIVAALLVSCQKSKKGSSETSIETTEPKTPTAVMSGASTSNGNQNFGDQLAQLRFQSFALRDEPPSAEESQSIIAGTVTRENLVASWMQSPAHTQRIFRFFDDMIGVGETSMIRNFGFALKVNNEGVYDFEDKRLIKPNCSTTNAVTVSPWWLDSGQTIRACPSTVSDHLQVMDAATGKPVKCSAKRAKMATEGCGCGPAMIACFPSEAASNVFSSIRNEFSRRGAAVYTSGGTWNDLLGGDRLVANRYLAWAYLYTTKISPLALDPNMEEINAVQKLPIDKFVETDYPKLPTKGTPSGEIRAGIVTAPGFLTQFNTYRARIRGLVQGLLCKDIDATLGNDVNQYINPLFSDFDRSHGVKDGCSGCHFPMDNMGSLNFGWDGQGRLQMTQASSLIGHAFGQDGSGPAFLAKAFIERAPEFKECMAKRAFESFTGFIWSTLAKNEQTTLIAAATNGPKAIINAVLKSSAFLDARLERGVTVESIPPMDNSGTNSSTGARNGLDFAIDINPILRESCGGISCHGAGAPNTQFVDNQGVFLSGADQIVARTGAGGGMPPPSSGFTLSPDNRSKILKFLGK